MTLFNEAVGVSAVSSARIQRWGLKLSAYQYTFRYRPGSQHCNTDGLSRLPCKTESDQSEREQVPELANLINRLSSMPVSATDIKRWSQQDPVLSRVLRYVQNGWAFGDTDTDQELEPFRARAAELSMNDGCLLWGKRVIIPPQGREKVLAEMHAGHQGICRMKDIASMVAWYG